MTLLHEELTEKIIGALFKVYNSLGLGYKEKEYQKALASEFDRLGLKYKRELYSNVKFNEKVIAGFYVDFLLEDSVVVELKVAKEVYLKHRQQVIQYLKNHDLKVGLIGVITENQVLIKRIIN